MARAPGIDDPDWGCRGSRGREADRWSHRCRDNNDAVFIVRVLTLLKVDLVARNVDAVAKAIKAFDHIGGNLRLSIVTAMVVRPTSAAVLTTSSTKSPKTTTSITTTTRLDASATVGTIVTVAGRLLSEPVGDVDEEIARDGGSWLDGSGKEISLEGAAVTGYVIVPVTVSTRVAGCKCCR